MSRYSGLHLFFVRIPRRLAPTCRRGIFRPEGFFIPSIFSLATPTASTSGSLMRIFTSAKESTNEESPYPPRTASPSRNRLLLSNRFANSMRIGINCLKIDPSFAGGLNTYALGLLDGFAATANGHRFHLYVSSLNQHLFVKYAGEKGFELIVAGDRLQGIRSAVCRATLLTQSQKLYELASNTAFSNLRAMMDTDCDIIYTPTVVLPCFNSRKPTVLSMHDIQHVHYPEFFIQLAEALKPPRHLRPNRPARAVLSSQQLFHQAGPSSTLQMHLRGANYGHSRRCKRRRFLNPCRYHCPVPQVWDSRALSFFPCSALAA